MTGTERIKARLRQAARRHVLDALDARGLVRGMRIVFPQPRVCALQSFEEAGPGPREVLVETQLSLVSAGTERAIYQSLPNVTASFPHVPGYCSLGRVVAAGPGARLQPGEIVVSTGAHASLHLCPEDRALPVPAGVAAEDAVFTQLAFIALQAVRKARIQPGENVLVLGAGAIGQLCALLAAVAGARVTLAAPSRPRLAVAQSAGVATLVLSEDGGRLEAMGASVVLEATGHPEAIKDALRGAARGARVVLVGSPRGTTPGLPLAEIEARELRIVGAHTDLVPARDEAEGSWTWRSECETFLALLADARLSTRHLITRRAAPDEAPAVYASLADPADKSIAVLFDWSRPGPWRARIEAASPLRVAGSVATRLLGRARPQAPAALAARADGRRLRFGLIGCGEIAAENARAIRASGNADVTFAADPNLELARALAAASGAAAASSSEALLDSPDVDAVVISTPHHLHAPLAIRAAERGKHVVVEKPMALSVRECDEMIAAAASRDVRLSVCYCQRFEPAVQEARRLLAAGAVGKVYGTRISFGQWRGPEYWTEGLSGVTRGDWRRYRGTAGGGVLIMNACHVLDFVTWLVGSPIAEVTATQGNLASDVEVEDSIALSYRYRDGAIGSLDATTALVGPWVYAQEIWGRDGRLSLGSDVRYWSARVIDGRDRETWHRIRPPQAPARARYFAAFADAVLDGGELPVTAQQARSVQAAIQSAYESVETGRTVRIDA